MSPFNINVPAKREHTFIPYSTHLSTRWCWGLLDGLLDVLDRLRRALVIYFSSAFAASLCMAVMAESRYICIYISLFVYFSICFNYFVCTRFHPWFMSSGLNPRFNRIALGVARVVWRRCIVLLLTSLPLDDDASDASGIIDLGYLLLPIDWRWTFCSCFSEFCILNRKSRNIEASSNGNIDHENVVLQIDTFESVVKVIILAGTLMLLILTKSLTQ